MYRFSRQSIKNLETCKQDLQIVAQEAIRITPIDFAVLCGYRDKIKQLIAFQEGNSHLTWPDSKHNSAPSMAMDLAPYPIQWLDTDRFWMLAGVILSIAKRLDVNLSWGGLWKIDDWGPDLTHFELKK